MLCWSVPLRTSNFELLSTFGIRVSGFNSLVGEFDVFRTDVPVPFILDGEERDEGTR